MTRESVDLCGVWKFLPDPREDAELTVCSNHFPDTAHWREALVPSTFETCLADLDCYEGIVWFSRAAPVPVAWEGRRIALRFDGVNHHCAIWVNGRHAGGNDDGFLPFEIDLTGLVRPGATSSILLRVDNVRREPDLPGTFAGWRNQGGILREVSLVATGITRLHEVRVEGSSHGDLTVSWDVRHGGRDSRRCAVTALILDPSGAPCAEIRGREEDARLTTRIEPVSTWSPEHPFLYRAEVSLSSDGEPQDSVTRSFGFRSIAVRGGRLLLNGEPVTLVGWNRHEDSPARGMAQDLDATRRDLQAMKEAGANFVRLCHYPHHPGELDLCDEIGLAAMAEIPLYGWGGAETREQAEAKLAVAARQLERMIQRDATHPSVLFWSVSNETDEGRPEVVEANKSLIRLARRLDPSRIATHVSFRWQQDPHFEEEEVACVNFYPAVAGPRAIRGHEGISKAADEWRRALDALHAACPGKPILVTEFGFPSVTGTVDDGMALDQQARVIESEMAAFRERSFVCGATIWCWADHLWPPGTFDNGVGVSPYGVMTRGRQPKPALAKARALFRAARGLLPARAGESGVAEDVAGFLLTMIRPHLREIPRFDLPPGFSLRSLSVLDAGLWTDVERDAEDFYRIDDGTFLREFGEDVNALSWRSFVALDERGLAVGVITAWYLNDFRGLDWGRIHWLAVRRSCRRRGIGRAMLSFALTRLSQWHERALLFTQSRRTDALRLYLDFGFQPDLEPPGAAAAWRRIAADLRHPGLATPGP